MVTEHLEQAAALRKVIGQHSHVEGGRSELTGAVLDCCERLLLWGEAQTGLDLLGEFSSDAAHLGMGSLLAIELARIKCLSVMQKDHEALDRAARVLKKWDSYPASSEAD